MGGRRPNVLCGLALGLALLAAGGRAAAQPEPEVLYSLEVDRETILSTDRSGSPATSPAEWAASLARATAVRAYVFEPIAAVPTPRLAAILVEGGGRVIRADSDGLERSDAAALAVVALGRTVETFVAGAAEGGGFVVVLERLEPGDGRAFPSP